MKKCLKKKQSDVQTIVNKFKTIIGGSFYLLSDDKERQSLKVQEQIFIEDCLNN